MERGIYQTKSGLQQLFRPNFGCNRETGQSISTEGNKGNKDWGEILREFHEFALIGVIRVKAVIIPEGTFLTAPFARPAACDTVFYADFSL
jgi:hypothetical protein